ncbi:MAG: N,N-dimethylformamidase beta subunit family domain-containing protein [Nitrospirota bacterium]
MIGETVSPVRSLADSPIAQENARPGNADWVLTDPADHEVEGYASATSIQRGDQLRFYIHSTDPSVTVAIYRMGWYGGAGARLVQDGISLPGVRQPMPTADPVTGLIECDWQVSYTLNMATDDPGEWLSGIYLAKLSGTTSGKQSYIIFVVREDDRPADVLFQSSVTTFQAYNNWGGKSTYPSNSRNEQWARKVSFNRPYAASQHPRGTSGTGAGEFLTAMSIHPTRSLSTAGWEYNMVRWLERNGYDVTYSTDIDTHSRPGFWKGHKAWLSVGHDEYWSDDMRRHVEAARDQGLGLGFFSSNTCYWQIRLDPSTITGEPNRTMVSYKEVALAEDPYALDGDPSNDHLITVQWRDQPLNRPEHKLLGVMFETVPVDGDLVITRPSHPLFSGIPLPPDHRLPGLLGYEIDRAFPDGPAKLEILAHSPYQRNGQVVYGDMTLYQAPSGARVFATGTIQWSWDLDDYNAPALRTARTSEAAQQITRNILELLARKTLPAAQ